MNPDMLYIKHIRDAIERIEKYTSVGKEAFFHEHHLARCNDQTT